MNTAYFTILILVAARRSIAKRQQGRHGDVDSGRSVLVNGDAPSFVEPLEGERGLEPGLAPWPVQARLAAQEEFRRLNLPLLECRSQFIEALQEAGPKAERIASLAVEAARDFLEDVLDTALAGIPAVDEADPEILEIQASLNAGQRYPAADVMEARWKRLIRLSRAPPDESVQRIRQLFRKNSAHLWLTVERTLSAESEGGGRMSQAQNPRVATDTINKFEKCLQHRISPQSDFNNALDRE